MYPEKQSCKRYSVASCSVSHEFDQIVFFDSKFSGNFASKINASIKKSIISSYTFFYIISYIFCKTSQIPLNEKKIPIGDRIRHIC